MVHGRSYFPRLLGALRELRAGDLVALTDWRGDPDQRLDGPGTELGEVLAAAARRGVHVKGLLWRSHPSRAHFNEEPNLHLGAVVNHAGGEVLLDERVRGSGCQHQKLVVLRHPGRLDRDVAFLGGIDLCHGRGDDERHLGDPQAALDLVRAAGGDRAAVYDLENQAGTPIYVHAKVCVADDVWATVGSDNLNRRSWTHDSELTAAVLDSTLDPRAPEDPAGLGDGARVFARELRLRLWREHLGRAPGDDGDLLDPDQGFHAWRKQAAALDAWHRSDRAGPRPPGRALEHRPGRVRPWAAWWAWPLYTTVIDPDGRPWRLRRAGGF